MCFYRTKLYKACGHTEFRRFMCNPAPNSNIDDKPEDDATGSVHMKSRFACGEQPQHVNDLDLGVCSRCRKAMNPKKGTRRRDVVLDKEQRRTLSPSIRVFVPLWESDANNPKDDPEQPVIRSFLPDPCVNKTRFDEKVEDSDMVAADAMEDGNLYGADIKEALQECPQIREEYSFAQNQITSMLKSLNDRQEHRLADFSNRSEVPPTGIQRKSPKQPQQTGQTVTPPHPFDANLRLLSHSATRVRRGLYEAQGRVRSMIDAINGKGDASQMISFVDNRSMVTSMVKTIHRGRKSENPASPEQPITPNKKNSSTKRRLQRLPYSDLQTLPKAAKLQVVAKHEFHRLAPIVEEPNPQFLVLAKYVANTVVLRRAKAIKVRNLNAFHCPVRQPRFGLKRKVLAPPVPRHSTPPVAVPCSKYVDLGRRRVSKMEWCFVV